MRAIGLKSSRIQKIKSQLIRGSVQHARKRQWCGASAQAASKLRLSSAGLAKAVFVCMILSRLTNNALPSARARFWVSREEGIPINSLHGS
jgi:hypothetical protein